ncbi:MAG: hypothetical protein AB1505_21690 [Candidatus Latescibacterota bacterium]
MTPTPIPPGQVQLFLDDALLAETRDLARRWHPLRKHPANPLLARSGAETQIYLFGTVHREPEPLAGAPPGGGSAGQPVFRMWYYAAGEGRTWIGYARSADGLHWERPELGLFPGEPGLAANAVFAPPGWRLIDLNGVVRDPRVQTPAAERYHVMLSADAGERGPGGAQGKHCLPAVSPDGLHWEVRPAFRPPAPCYPDRACFVWDPYRQVWVLYSRCRHNPPELVARGGPNYFGRAIGRGESPDLQTWTAEWPPVMQAEVEDPDGTEIYGWSAFPCGGQWLALTQVHHSLPHQACIDLALSHSRDGVHWQRRSEVLLSLGEVGEWDRFNQCASTLPLCVGDEVWVYYSGRLYRHGEYRRHPEWRPDAPRRDSGPSQVAIGLATLRLDGWCSLEAGFGGGALLTQPVVLPEGEVWVNARADWGKVTVEFLDEHAAPLPGIPLARPLTADGVRQRVAWDEQGRVPPLTGRPVRLRLTLENAQVYGWGVG